MGGGTTFGVLGGGSGRSGRYSGSKCELQESVAVVARCAYFERGCCFARAAVGFVFGLCVRVGSASLLELSRCLVCRVASLVERCDTCLWLLPSLSWLVVNSGEVEVHRLANVFWWCFPELFVVVLLFAVALPLRLSCCATSGLRYAVVVLAEQLLALWVEVLPKLPCVVLAVGQEVGFVPCTLRALPDGSIVSAVGVWLFVLLWKCRSRLVVFPFMWKRLVVRVSFPCFTLFTRGDVAPLWCCVTKFSLVGCASGTTCGSLWFSLWFLVLPCRHTLADGCLASVIATFVAKVPPLLSCFEVELVAPLVRVVFLWCDRAACPVFSLCLEALVVVWCMALSACVVGAVVYFVPFGAWVHCVVPWVALGACIGTVCCAVCLDRSPISGTSGFGCGLCLGFPSRHGERVCLVGVPCFGVDPFEVDVLPSTFVVVLFPVRFADVFIVVCPGQTTRMIWVGSSGADGHCPTCRGVLHVYAIAWHSLCGKLKVATTGKSRCDLVVGLHLFVAAELPVTTVIRVATALCVAFLSPSVNDAPTLPFGSFSLPSSSPRWEASFPFFSGGAELGGAATARAEHWSVVVERGGGGRGFVKALVGVRFFIISRDF
ncbi:hypothetical protein Taro_053204 [Colocasia esculenta]|uniref:Uncharacterized protein n=1 Tax=Colocasia esculenta TaxID=4460 RepID=A0A843XMG1_COLES|nr:hypothetical protein [Colocasia esculenta]